MQEGMTVHLHLNRPALDRLIGDDAQMELILSHAGE